MKKLFLVFTLSIVFLSLPHRALAFDRDAVVSGARSVVNSNYTYNVITNVISAGPVQVGSTNKSLPAYQQVAQIMAQIQALKLQLKNFSPR